MRRGQRLVREAMAEGGKSVTEIVKIWGAGAERALDLVREVRGEALFDAALAAGKGVIIAAPHLGCWELLNYWLCRKTPMAILYRPPRIAAVEAPVAQSARRAGAGAGACRRRGCAHACTSGWRLAARWAFCRIRSRVRARANSRRSLVARR